MSRPVPQETTRVTRPPFLDGVEMLSATFVRHSFSRHFHEEYALGCIEQGAMRFRYLGSSHTAPQGCVNLVVPGEAHDGHAAVDQGWTYRMFYIQPEVVRRAATELSQGAGLPHFRMGVIHDPDLAARVRSVHVFLEDHVAPRLAKQSRLLDLLVTWISRHGAEPGSLPRVRPEHGAARRVRDLIRERCGQDLCLDQLAAVAGMSPYHLIRVFSRAYGVTPHAYLVQTRVRRAKDLLASGVPIALAAQDAGFADQSHLNRAFKRFTGVTPGRYRNSVQDA